MVSRGGDLMSNTILYESLLLYGHDQSVEAAKRLRIKLEITR